MSEPNGALAGRVVVVIEDDALQRLAQCMMLDTWGCQVAAAGSAAEAEQVVRTLTTPPDIILSDVWLPDGAAGEEAIARLRWMVGRDVPALLLTGDTDRRQTLPRTRVLYKPYPPATLFAAMVDLLPSGL
ncbi:MAG: two-component hybrid sensor and regulator (modular protein) [Rhodospirillaceae bacterium]|nr:MAG: two-component hybrid sensor and regulator (modular protein) [Rhodospirillaceae bacterium]